MTLFLANLAGLVVCLFGVALVAVCIWLGERALDAIGRRYSENVAAAIAAIICLAAISYGISVLNVNLWEVLT